MAGDENIQLDSEFTYQQYAPPPVSNVTNIAGVAPGGAVTTINGDSGGGAVGPVIAFSGGATGLSVTASGSSLTLTGTAAPTALNEVITAIDYLLSDANDIVLVDTSGGDVTITLHDPSTAKQKYYDMKITVAGNDMILDGDGSDIDGNPTVSSGTYDPGHTLLISFTIVPNNATGEWWIV